jgi:hypothetical protein
MKVTEEMFQRAHDAHAAADADGGGVRERLRAALEAALEGATPVELKHSRWDAFSDEELGEINAGASERADKLSLPEEIRSRAVVIKYETERELRRRKGGYQGPGVYESPGGDELEVLGRHGEDGGIVLRKVGDSSGFLYFETWNSFNSPGTGAGGSYRYLRPLRESS